MEFENLRVEREKGKVTIVLNRPEKLNALDPTLARELRAVLSDLDLDPGMRVLTLTGEGRGFCSGADVSRKEDDEPIDVLEILNGVIRLMHSFRKPIIGAINGVAAGAGLSLAMACDIRIASTEARFSAIFVRRALSVDCGLSYVLPRAIGLSRALELMYTGEIIDAETADRIGLVSRVVEHDRLLEATGELAEAIAQAPPLAVTAIRNITHSSQESSHDSALELEQSTNMWLGETEDFREGVQAFLQKRAPAFKGR